MYNKSIETDKQTFQCHLLKRRQYRWLSDQLCNDSRYLGIYILKSEASVRLSVCLCHGQHAVGDRRCFLSPCDKRKHTGHAHQQAASPASIDSAWRYPLWLPHSSLGLQRPVGRRSYHNKLARAAVLRLTPQATIARIAIVAYLLKNSQDSVVVMIMPNGRSTVVV